MLYVSSGPSAGSYSSMAPADFTFPLIINRLLLLYSVFLFLFYIYIYVSSVFKESGVGCMYSRWNGC